MSDTTIQKLEAVAIEQSKPLRERYIELLLAESRGEHVLLDEIGTLRAALDVDQDKLRRHLHAAKEWVEGERAIQRAEAARPQYDALCRAKEEMLKEKEEFLSNWKARFAKLTKETDALQPRAMGDELGRKRQAWAREVLEQ